MNYLKFLSLLLALNISCKVAESEEEFRNTEFAGTIIKLEYQGRAVYTLSIRDFHSKDTLTYHLFISKFIEDNRIADGDSINKEIGHDVFFYRKIDETEFSGPLKLYYH